MASLFALGIMSVTWMAVVAGLIAFEKTVPWRRVATYATAAVLLVLGLLVLAAPDSLPGLTTPRDAPMTSMGSSRGVTPVRVGRSPASSGVLGGTSARRA
jgi:cytochrome c biogenesis protein CcdA